MTTAHDDDPVRGRVAANVRMYRQARRLTLEELADRCADVAGLSISAAALLRIEQAKRGVEAGDLVALALALRVGVPDLLGPTIDESAATLVVGARRSLPRSEYIALIGVPEHLIGMPEHLIGAGGGRNAAAGGRGAGAGGDETVLVPAAQMEAIASAFAAVGEAAGEAARQFGLVTGMRRGVDHPVGHPSASLREAGYTTEQLRDRFGPTTPLHEPAAADPR